MCAYLAARARRRLRSTPCAPARARYRPLPHRMELVGDKRQHLLLRRQQGHERRVGRGLGARLPAPARADRRRRRQGRLVRADARGARRRVQGHRADRQGRAADPRGAPRTTASTYPVIDATDMHDAVRRATELCAAGDAVVLSPACASYDMFQNFGHRGRVFREAVARSARSGSMYDSRDALSAPRCVAASQPAVARPDASGPAQGAEHRADRRRVRAPPARRHDDRAVPAPTARSPSPTTRRSLDRKNLAVGQ